MNATPTHPWETGRTATKRKPFELTLVRMQAPHTADKRFVGSAQRPRLSLVERLGRDVAIELRVVVPQTSCLVGQGDVVIGEARRPHPRRQLVS